MDLELVMMALVVGAFIVWLIYGIIMLFLPHQKGPHEHDRAP